MREMRRDASKQTCSTTNVRGIWNMSNTCYMTSVLESMVHNPLMRNFYLSEGHKPVTCPRAQASRPCLSCNFYDMFQQFNNTESKSAFSAQHILGTLLSRKEGTFDSLVPGKQQDAHEFLTYLFNELHDIN